MTDLATLCTIKESFHTPRVVTPEPVRIRRLTVELRIPIVPYTRTTQKSRHIDERAKRYVAFIGQARDLMRFALWQAQIEPFHGKAPLRMAGEVRFARRNFAIVDLSNAVKSLEDAANTCLYDDDRYVHAYGAWQKRLAASVEECGATFTVEEMGQI